MPQIYTTVTDEMVEKIKKIANDQDRSFSKVVSDMIEIGVKATEIKGRPEDSGYSKMKEFEFENKMEYLTCLLGVTSDILRSVYNKEVSLYKKDTAQEELDAIKKEAKNFILNKIRSVDNRD